MTPRPDDIYTTISKAWQDKNPGAFDQALNDALANGEGFIRITSEGAVHVLRGDIYVPAVPEPYYWGLFSWMWKRLTGWRDQYGRKAQLFWERYTDGID